MDFCNTCGNQTEPDWVFCRACGNSLEDLEAEAATAQKRPVSAVPKVELISRGWDVVDVHAVDIDGADIDTIELPDDPLETDPSVPLQPGTIEITIDDVTVVERATVQEAEPEDVEEQPPEEEPAPAAADAWDHLRPHGQIPGVSEPTRLPARVGQSLIIIASLAALVSAVLYLLVNVQLDRFAAGRATDQSVIDLRTIAEASLLVLGGLALLALGTVGWWMMKAYPISRFEPGPAGAVAVPAFVGGTFLVIIFATQDAPTVSDELTANSLIVLGLGLIMMAGLAAIRTIRKIDNRARR